MKTCECGCGQPTLPYRKTSTRDGTVKGEPSRFATLSCRQRFNSAHPRLHGPLWVEEDRGHGTPCWTWRHGKTSDGYGAMGEGLAHRVIYERETGRPAGPQLHHACRNRDCVNPAHLEPKGGQAEHMIEHRVVPDEEIVAARRAGECRRDTLVRLGISVTSYYRAFTRTGNDMGPARRRGPKPAEGG